MFTILTCDRKFKEAKYVLDPLPLFIPDFDTKPKEPKHMSKPKTPRLPDELVYKTPLKWYQKPLSAIIKNQQDESR